MAAEGVSFDIGFDEPDRAAAAILYDEAFRQKLAPAIPDDLDRQNLLAAGFDTRRAIAAYLDGELVGLAGFHDEGGSLTGGITFDLARDVLGFWRALRAFAVFGLLDRSPKRGELLMDGIVVRSDSRGKGIGSGLFSALETMCHERGLATIRLDVVDTNPGARRLYERLGFEPTKTESLRWLRPIMGFGASTEMVKVL